MRGWRKPDIRAVLLEERLVGYLDPGAERYLIPLNEPPKLSTTSSCLGRIALVEARYPWLRDDARIVYKTHDPITVEEVKRVLSRPFEDLWLKASGPIIHFKTPEIECAALILEAARSSGFKHSGIISVSSGYTVEVMSSTEFEAPLRIGGKDLYREDSLAAIVKLANETLAEGRKRLEKLVKEIRNNDENACF
jgi:tRNA wybutosine-synthesizing protein 3